MVKHRKIDELIKVKHVTPIHYCFLVKKKNNALTRRNPSGFEKGTMTTISTQWK